MSAESIAAGIIKNAAFVPERAAAYGFVHKDGVYAYTTVISDGQFSLTIECGPDGFLRSEIKERDTDEPYTLPFVAGAAGGFVGAVRAEYERVLADIAEHCFQRRAFKERQTQRLLDYAKDKYGDCPEFLWDNSENAVLRRGDNKKWYAVFLTVRKARRGGRGKRGDYRFENGARRPRKGGCGRQVSARLSYEQEALDNRCFGRAGADRGNMRVA